jgi:hypothetical protein
MSLFMGEGVKNMNETYKQEDEALFCPEHKIPLILVDREDESVYLCPECEREKGELLGWE